MRDHSLYLKDIVGAMEAVEKFVEGIDFDRFQNDDLISSAVIRKFEIIGEASRREMAGMRDRLIHFYIGVKYELVWHTIKDIIPGIKPHLEKALKDFNRENNQEI
jgi:uncharacterized protein with HEPN domain